MRVLPRARVGRYRIAEAEVEAVAVWVVHLKPVREEIWIDAGRLHLPAVARLVGVDLAKLREARVRSYQRHAELAVLHGAPVAHRGKCVGGQSALVADGIDHRTIQLRRKAELRHGERKRHVTEAVVAVCVEEVAGVAEGGFKDNLLLILR